MAGLSSGAGVAWDRLLFSAKEAVFKAWFFVERSWLGFEECQIDLREEGTFSARLPERFSRHRPGCSRALTEDGFGSNGTRQRSW